jgi:hypothetical protein
MFSHLNSPGLLSLSPHLLCLVFLFYSMMGQCISNHFAMFFFFYVEELRPSRMLGLRGT